MYLMRYVGELTKPGNGRVELAGWHDVWEIQAGGELFLGRVLSAGCPSREAIHCLMLDDGDDGDCAFLNGGRGYV
jgi:hypothetical protein